MKKIIVISIVMLLIAVIVLPVLGNKENENIISTSLNGGWIKHFEGTSWGHTVIQTSDGGYLIGGGTGYNDGSDALLIKTDSEGNMEWEKTFGSSMGWDAFEGLVEVNDGGFVTSGTKNGKGFLTKVNTNGNTLWEKTYGESTDGYCIDVRQTPDEGFILTGILYSQPRRGWLIKTDSKGNELWSKIYGDEFPVTLHSVKLTADGGFIFAGWESGDDVMAWAIKTNDNGDIEWEKFYDSSNIFHSGMETSDGSFIFTGSTSNVNQLNFGQITLVKTNDQGTQLWNKNFGTPIFGETSLWVEETTDGGYVVIGYYLGIGKILNMIRSDHFHPLWSKIWLLKIDSSGNLEWDKKLETGYGRCVKQTADGGFIITGQRGAYNIPEGALLIKTDENGNIN